MRELVIFKIDRQGFLDAFTAARLKAVNIIPSILVKRIPDQGRTENKTYLALGEAGPELINHILGDDIALWNIQFVHAGK